MLEMTKEILRQLITLIPAIYIGKEKFTDKEKKKYEFIL